MSGFAPYTRDTLARIRQGASARELGWDETFYASVCRKHGLRIPQAEPPSESSPVVISYNPRTRVLKRASASIVLPVRQGLLFETIARAGQDAPVTRAMIAMALGVGIGSVGAYVTVLRDNLAKLHLDIAARGGRGTGGYRICCGLNPGRMLNVVLAP